jgi:hypothetical protein
MSDIRKCSLTRVSVKGGFTDYQVKVHEPDRDKTTFATPFDPYRFLRLPFGSRNAPATFQRLIAELKTILHGVNILVSLDDIINWLKLPFYDKQIVTYRIKYESQCQRLDCGGVLLQGKEHEDRPIEYASRLLISVEWLFDHRFSLGRTEMSRISRRSTGPASETPRSPMETWIAERIGSAVFRNVFGSWRGRLVAISSVTLR